MPFTKLPNFNDQQVTICLKNRHSSSRLSKLVHELIKSYFCRKRNRMNRPLIKPWLIFVAFALISLVFTADINAQTANKKSDHKEDVMQADAYALAYINCKYDLLRYNSETRPGDQTLKKQLLSVSGTKARINRYMNKYGRDFEVYAKFTKLVERAKSDLPTCKKYQNILNALEELEKAKK